MIKSITDEFLSHLLRSEKFIGSLISSGFKSNFLDTTTDFSATRSLFEVICSFYLKYKRIIDREHLPSFIANDKYTQEQVNEILMLFESVMVLVPTKEFEFLVDSIKRNHAKTILTQKLDSGITSLEKNQMERALRLFKEGIFQVENIFNSTTREGTIQDSVAVRESNYMENKGGKKFGLRSGFPTFDRLTGGMKPGELIIIMSGPREGKSTALLNIAYNVQAVYGKNVFFVSAENPKLQFERRYDSLHSGLSCTKLRDGTLTEEEEALYKKSLAEIGAFPGKLFVWDQPISTPQSINAKLLELESLMKFDLIVVDYLSLIKPDLTTKNVWQDVGNVALGLREIARSRNIPVITAVQTGKEATKKQNISYENYDIAFSFSVVYHADTILTLRVKNPEILKSGDGICEITASLTKCRDGSQGEFVIDAAFDRMKMVERTFSISPTQGQA